MSLIANLKDADRHWLTEIDKKVSALADGGEVYSSILDWLERNMVHPSSDRNRRFSPLTAPWFNDVLLAIESGRYNTISVLGAVGSGKSTLIEQFLAWVISQAPGPTLVVGQSDSDCADWAESRLWPTLFRIPALEPLLPKDADSKRRLALICHHMCLWLAGGNTNSTQSKSCRYVIIDEAWRLGTGILTEAAARCHGRKDRLLLVTGQGGLGGISGGDEHWNLNERCAKNEWAWTCPACHAVNPYSFKQQLAYEPVKNARDELDRAATAESVRLICPACKAEFRDKPEVRETLGGLYVPVESNPMQGAIAFHIPAIALPHVRWADLAIAHEDAVARLKLGDASEIKAWKQKNDAVFWDEVGNVPKRTLLTQDYSLRDYEDGKTLLQNEAFRIMAVDFQTLKRYAIVRAYDADLNSRLIACRCMDNDEEVVALQEHFNVLPRLTFLDIGFDTYNVGLLAITHGYRCLRGSGKIGWTSPKPSNDTKTLESPISPLPLDEVVIRGLSVPYRYFSSFSLRDRLEILLQNPNFGIPRDYPLEYAEHLAAERKVIRYTVTAPPRPIYELKSGAQNHWADCEVQALVFIVELGHL